MEHSETEIVVGLLACLLLATSMAVVSGDSAAEQAQDNKGTKQKQRNNCPGVRVVGGRIYDSRNGKTCHQVTTLSQITELPYDLQQRFFVFVFLICCEMWNFGVLCRGCLFEKKNRLTVKGGKGELVQFCLIC